MAKPATSVGNSVDHLQWGDDLIRFEIVLWERLDRRLRAEHDLPLSFFEPLHHVARAPADGLRVGDLANALRVTVGGTSKLVDRICAAGLLARQPDPVDRRAARVVLTAAGTRIVKAAVRTYQAELAATLDPALDPDEQGLMHDFLGRLLETATMEERT